MLSTPRTRSTTYVIGSASAAGNRMSRRPKVLERDPLVREYHQDRKAEHEPRERRNRIPNVYRPDHQPRQDQHERRERLRNFRAPVPGRASTGSSSIERPAA